MNEKQWRWSLLNWIVLWVLLALALYLSGVRLAQAQADETEAAGQPPYRELRLYLRYSDGTAVAGEPLVLERLPEEIPMPCLTDERGRCTWQVGRGLYQVLFERPLDQISALSLAEGGLRGFGLTVGQSDIAYHFVFYHDGRAYFDAAPDAFLPKPILPQFHSVQGGVLPFIDEEVLPAETTGQSPTQTVVANTTPDPMPETVVAATSPSGVTLLLLVGLGLLLGGGLHLLQRGWSQPRRRETTAVTGQVGPDEPLPLIDPSSVVHRPSSPINGPSSPQEDSPHA